MGNLRTRINARLDPALARRVEAVQRRTGKRLSEIITESLDRYCVATLEEGASPYEALVATGFVGCIDGPVDLSRTYKEELAASLDRKR
jgi:hypothetical protein